MNKNTIFICALLFIVIVLIIVFFIIRDNFSIKHSDPSIKLFHWNIHFACFTNSNGNCDFRVRDGKRQNVKQYIMKKYFKDIDFANLIMFEENEVNEVTHKKFKLIHPKIQYINCSNRCQYSSLVQKCGKHDIPLNLVYNAHKWEYLKSESGCINTNCSNTTDDSRPFIIGKFKSKKNKNFTVFVICVYMQHPWDLDPTKTIEVLNNSLNTLEFQRKDDKLIFMSDTNLLGSEDNAQVFKNLDDRSNNMSQNQYLLNEYLASQLSDRPIKNRQYFTPSNIKTCCNDNTGFKYDFDRIFTNFGNQKLTTIISNDELEKPILSTPPDLKVPYTDEMHRPLLLEINY